jgi:hypothetical protein
MVPTKTLADPLERRSAPARTNVRSSADRRLGPVNK